MTGVSLFDYWTLAHLGFWVFVGSTIAALKWQRELSLAGCMGLALGWEIFERFAERGWPHLWEHPESFVNAWISDPLTCLVGVSLMF